MFYIQSVLVSPRFIPAVLYTQSAVRSPQSGGQSILYWLETSLLQSLQVRSVLCAYTHVRTWSDQKILKFLAIVFIFNT